MYKALSSNGFLEVGASAYLVNGEHLRIIGINPPSLTRVINGTIPLKGDDFYQDNNYFRTADTLADGQTVTEGEFSPADNPSVNLLYQPYELTLDLMDYNANVRKVRIFDTNGAGWDVGIFLMDPSGTEHKIGDYTGNSYQSWTEFEYDPIGHTATPFQVIRILFRALSPDFGIGSEIQVVADYDPYIPKPYNKPLKPLKYQMGFNAHDYNIWNNVGVNFFENRYQMILKLKPSSIRYFQPARQLQVIQDQWSFNPTRSGWFDENVATRLKQDIPGIQTWDSVLGQFDWVTDLWNVPDANNYMTGTIAQINTYPGYTGIIMNISSAVGSGNFRKWFFTLNQAVPSGHTAADYNYQSDTPNNITSSGQVYFDISAINLPYTVGMAFKINAGHRSQFNIFPQNNTVTGRQSFQTWADVLGRIAYVYAQRKGTNTSNTTPYQVNTGNGNTFKVGTNTAAFGEFMNEPNAFWAGYDEFLNGRDLAAAWSIMYDGHKGLFPNCGVKNADPNFKMSISGLAVYTTDLMRGCVDWCRVHRGYLPNGDIDLPFDLIQFHGYSYTGGVAQFTGGVQGGLPVELSNVLDAIDRFNRFSNKYAANRPVIMGEWGWDVHPDSNINAPTIGSYDPEHTRGNWAIRAWVECAAHGLDLSNWYRLQMDFDSDINISLQFSTMYLYRTADDGSTVTPAVIGYYFGQITNYWGDYVFDSRINNENPRVLRFVNPNTNKVIYFIWAVESPTNQAQWGSVKPAFTENTGTYNLALPNGTQVRINQFSDTSFTMITSSITTVSTGSFPVGYSAKPIVVEII